MAFDIIFLLVLRALSEARDTFNLSEHHPAVRTKNVTSVLEYLESNWLIAIQSPTTGTVLNSEKIKRTYSEKLDEWRVASRYWTERLLKRSVDWISLQCKIAKFSRFYVKVTQCTSDIAPEMYNEWLVTALLFFESDGLIEIETKTLMDSRWGIEALPELGRIDPKKRLAEKMPGAFRYDSERGVLFFWKARIVFSTESNRVVREFFSLLSSKNTWVSFDELLYVVDVDYQRLCDNGGEKTEMREREKWLRNRIKWINDRVSKATGISGFLSVKSKDIFISNPDWLGV